MRESLPTALEPSQTYHIDHSYHIYQIVQGYHMYTSTTGSLSFRFYEASVMLFPSPALRERGLGVRGFSDTIDTNDIIASIDDIYITDTQPRTALHRNALTERGEDFVKLFATRPPTKKKQHLLCVAP